jgi:hypothetical protein
VDHPEAQYALALLVYRLKGFDGHVAVGLFPWKVRRTSSAHERRWFRAYSLLLGYNKG